MPKLHAVPPPEAVDAVLRLYPRPREEVEGELEAATPALHEQWLAEETASRVPDVLLEVHKSLGWVQAATGPYTLNAYWSPKVLPNRWHRFEAKRRAIVAGPLSVFIRKEGDEVGEERAVHLKTLAGGRA